MFVAETMNRISVLIMKEDMEAVVKEIARSGVLQLTRIEEIDAWADRLSNVGVSKLSADYSKRARRINDLIQELSPKDLGRESAGGEEIGLLDLEQVDKEVDRIEKQVQPAIAARRSLKQKMSELEGLRGQLESLAPAGMPVAGLMHSTLLSTAIGTIEESGLEDVRKALAPVPSVVLPYRKDGKTVSIIGVVLRRDKARLDEALEQAGFKAVRLPDDFSEVSASIQAHAGETENELEQQMEKAEADLRAVTGEVIPELMDMSRRVQAAVLLLNIKDYFKVTEKTCLFSGWVPEEETEDLVSNIKQTSHGSAVIEVTGADKLPGVAEGSVEVPVLFKQPPFLKPFSLLVSGYGTPSYRMIDPTIFVGITFLVMFGMMFGDVGHGLVLLAGSILVALKSRKWHEAGKLGAYCGVSSIIFGFLFGSFFGLDNLLPTLWLKPLEDMTDLFSVAIGFGVVMVSLGIVLNIINSFRAHSFWVNFFDKSGPLVGVVYWAGIGIGVKIMIMGGGPPHPAIFYGFFIAPLAVFTLRGPLLKMMGKKKRNFPDGLATYVMESVVEVMEILMGYLANTISFIRVAAFGLAHAGLFVAVFSLARVVSAKPGGVFFSWLVLILGNVVIILLEGLVVTIQALRLEYYEFFGKFFKGLGSKYEPAGAAGVTVVPRGAKGGE
ncbi:MAG: V-type ATPase 116kDa subunit family protein [bacterium]|jgi:V/A-type H+-transporting ATPase subunit I